LNITGICFYIEYGLGREKGGVEELRSWGVEESDFLIRASMLIQLYTENHMKIYILYSACLVALLVPMGEAVAQAKIDHVVKRTSEFELKGDGTSPEWSKASWLPLPKRKGTATYETRAKLLYSETGIYGMFECSDTKIIATMKEDFADLWKEDVIEIFFWTDESTPLYFEYELSPLNYELPILVPNFGGDFWDGDRGTTITTARHAMQQK
jgi:hypothetical protein